MKPRADCLSLAQSESNQILERYFKFLCTENLELRHIPSSYSPNWIDHLGEARGGKQKSSYSVPHFPSARFLSREPE